VNYRFLDDEDDQIDPPIRAGDQYSRGILIASKKPTEATNADLVGNFGRIHLSMFLNDDGEVSVTTERNILVFDGIDSFNSQAARLWHNRRMSHAHRYGAALLFCALCLPGLARAETYEVGPGRALTALNTVPWESLGPGDVVRIHHRAEPYREKLVLAVNGSESQPIRIEGVRGPGGERPVLEADGATTREELNFWGENRGLIKIGGANTPDSDRGSYLILEGLELRGARSPRGFTGRDGASSYVDNAAAIFIEAGEHIVVRDCALYDSGNGLFVANASRDIRVESCEIADNGNPGSIYEHNVYSEALGIVFEGNHLRPLCSGCPGNNLKDRSAGTVIRYNWIEGGNRQLDLVDSSSATLRAEILCADKGGDALLGPMKR
jgi:hypothetical protein